MSVSGHLVLWTIVLLAVVLPAPVLIDRWIRTVALPRIAARVVEVVGAPVDLHVPGALWRAVLVDRRLARVDVELHGVPVRDGAATLRRVDARLEDVCLRGRPHRPEVRASTGTFTAWLEEEQLGRLLDLPPLVERVRVFGDGLRVEIVTGLALPVEVTLDEGQLVVRPRSAQLRRLLPVHQFVLGLPELPLGARVTGIELRDGHVEASGPLDVEAVSVAAGTPRRG